MPRGEHDRRGGLSPHERTEEAPKTLEEGIDAILTGEAFAAYLRTMARFHQYEPPWRRWRLQNKQNGVMANHTAGPERWYPPELRELAVRMYFEAVDRAGERHGVVTRVAQQLRIGAESLLLGRGHLLGARPAGICRVRTAVMNADRHGGGAKPDPLSDDTGTR